MATPLGHGWRKTQRLRPFAKSPDALSHLARQTPTAILIALSRPAFIEKLGLDMALTELDPVQFKGKSEPMRVFEFDGTSGDLESDSVPKLGPVN